jgi:membrane protein DedA with SNARE-associated domain
MLILLALSTLLAEDLTCLAAGALVASGQVGYVEATLACLFGIVLGDLGLYGVGRLVGRRILELPVLKSRVTADQLDRAAGWLCRHGAAVVFASRFTPGMPLPVYLAAGALRTNAARFTLYFAIASAVWTPILVGAATLLGSRRAQDGFSRFSWLIAVMAMMVVAPRLLTWERRRRILGMWRSIVRWEFWPAWAAYIPVLPWILFLAARHRSLTLFTAANPGIVSGGFAGESKSQILAALMTSGAVAPFTVVRRGQSAVVPDRWPVVLKPDVGERGNRVVIAQDENDYRRYLESETADTIVQDYVKGLEFGILYCRRPDERTGGILSITEKCFPAVVGDGRRTVKELILADDRAVCLAPVYLERNASRSGSVPEPGQRVRLVNIGSHCKGAVFTDARGLSTLALVAAVDAVSKVHPEFYLGRYDVRTPSLEHLQRGEFTVIELNGVTGEPTHIYDPAVSLADAYRALFRHWQLAFEIGAANRRRGYQPVGVLELVRIISRHLNGTDATHPAHSSGAAQVTSRLPVG